MAEIAVSRQPRQEGLETSRWTGMESPFLRGSLFGLNPFALMRQFTEDMDRAFGQVTTTDVEWRPVVEVKEKDGKLCILAEIPGVRKEDLKVNITDRVVTLEGERRREREDKREGYYHCERNYGRFLRSIPLPEGARTEQANAQFREGVLEINVPIPQHEKSKQIPIQ